MNSFTAVLLLVAIGVAHAKYDHEEEEKRFNLCKEETKAEETYESVVKEEKVPTSDKGMCLVECIIRRKGITTDEGKYDPEGAKAYVNKKFEDKPEKAQKVLEIFETCGKIDVEGLDKCETAIKYVTCAKAKAAQAGISKFD